MQEKTYSVGEVAELTGLTVRTLQHYDNIGLVSASGRTEGGRRYYAEGDLMRLEQVMFYKLLGFSLGEIARQLMDLTDFEACREMLLRQEYHLLRKIEQMHTAFSIIDAMLLVMDDNKQPSAHRLLESLRALPGDDIWENAPEMLTVEQKALFAPYFPSFVSAQAFYWSWKEIEIKAGALLHAGVEPSSPAAQTLAKQWWELLHSYPGLQEAEIPGMGEGDNPFIVSSEEYGEINRYIERAYARYVQNDSEGER